MAADTMNICLGLMWLAYAVQEVTSVCPNLANTNGVSTVNVTWKYDMWSKTGCEMWVDGSQTSTLVSDGDQGSLLSVHNGCLKFRCDNNSKTLVWDKNTSSCAHGSGCSRELRYGDECSQRYNCYAAVYNETPQFTYSGFYRYREGWFTIFSGYICGNTGSGHCADDQCFNPFADPKGAAASTHRCVDKGDYAVGPSADKYQCVERSTCSSHTYVDLAFSERGCDVNGSFIAEGSVTWSDPCRHTLCVIDDSGDGTLITSFINHEGCVYEDQCVAVGETVAGVLQYTCANLTCRKNDSNAQPSYVLEAHETGCYKNGTCYDQAEKVPVDAECDRLVCKQNVTTGKYYWDHQFECCYDPSSSKSYTYTNGKQLSLGKCITNKCEAQDYGRWRTSYKRSCLSPENASCINSDGLPGCNHSGICYPVKSVIRIDNCTQYVCFSDDPYLNKGQYREGVPAPQWIARATGCYGPRGCMKFGTQYVDSSSLNTYRCDYNFSSMGIKTAVFLKACVAPNGEKLALGGSVFIRPFWYSCYRYGKIRNPIDTSIEYLPEDHNHTCGLNPNKPGKYLYKGEYYYSSVGRCWRQGYFCQLECQYYDQPCMQTDMTPWRWLGDKFTLDKAECVCTQDYSINNIANPEDALFNTPSLCGEPGVTGGACKNPTDNKRHQWGEFWKRSGSNCTEVCTCHPLNRQAFCSSYLPDVVSALSNMKADHER